MKIITEFEIERKKFKLCLVFEEWEHFGGDFPLFNWTWWFLVKKGRWWVGIAYFREKPPYDKIPYDMIPKYKLVEDQMDKLLFQDLDYKKYENKFREILRMWWSKIDTSKMWGDVFDKKSLERNFLPRRGLPASQRNKSR